jgi:flagellar motor switch/type III secretory pathway protein FliN
MDEPPQPNTSVATAEAEAAALRALADAPVEVVAELGRVVLRGEEVLGLVRGAVLALGGRTMEVTLRVGDRPFARGELVPVDGALAVRVSERLGP